MGKVKWCYESDMTIREDMREALISCLKGIMKDPNVTPGEALAMIDGALKLYNALIPFTEVHDEDIQGE